MTRQEQVFALLKHFNNDQYSFETSNEEIRHAIEMSDYLDAQLALPVGTVSRELPEEAELEVEVEEDEEDEQEEEVLETKPRKHSWF